MAGLRVAMIHPYGKSITVVDPPANEQRPSGLLIPAGVDEFSVGIVVDGNDSGIPPGSLIYYHKHHGTEIKDCRVVCENCIIAWEDA